MDPHSGHALDGDDLRKRGSVLPATEKPASGLHPPTSSSAGVALSARDHYNRAAATSVAHRPQSEREARQNRNAGPMAPLKIYHNAVKRYLINSVVSRMGGCTSLLDLCCGRGGDIDKWLDAGIAEAHGVDISDEEIRLARRRFEMKRGRHRTIDPHYTFDVVETLGTERIHWPRCYDVVTCMFAAHFFPRSERMLDTFLGNVASALKDGGYFCGAIASGLGVLALLDRRDSYESPLLRVRRTWAGDHSSYSTFGSGYTFALGDTITNADVSSSEVVDDGAEEYLVFFGAFTELAARHGLVPDMSFPWDPEIGARSGGVGGLDSAPAGGKHHAFRMFRPRYNESVPHASELTKASRLYATFVFQKRHALTAQSVTPTTDASERPMKRPREGT